MKTQSTIIPHENSVQVLLPQSRYDGTPKHNVQSTGKYSTIITSIS